MQEQVTYFLDQCLVPHIDKPKEKEPVHEEGWVLSDYGMTSVSKLVRACKYENAGPFPAELVERAVEAICRRYPIGTIDAIVNVLRRRRCAMDLREEACLLLLVFESGLPLRIVNTILATWCKQLERTLQDFFDADAQEWIRRCQLAKTLIEKLERAKEKRDG